jgi:hypothetical protein
MSAQHPDRPEAAEPRKKQVSERQLAANRANARKSTGPKSAAGRLRASANSITHGMTARVVCFPGEDDQVFTERLQGYVDVLQPRNIVESDIIRDIVIAHTRKDRALKYEHVAIIDKQADQRVEIEQYYQSVGSEAETALAFKALCDNSTVLRQLDRHETRLRREIDSGWRQFERIRKMCPPASDSPEIPNQFGEARFQNEAIPTNEHPAAPAPEPIGTPANTLTLVRRKTNKTNDNPAPEPRETQQPLATSHSSQATEPTTDHELAARHSSLATRHSPLVKAAA